LVLPRSAPPGSLLCRLSLHALLFGNARAVAALWQRFLEQVRVNARPAHTLCNVCDMSHHTLCDACDLGFCVSVLRVCMNPGTRRKRKARPMY
jgi:hypothetical protein